MQRPSGDVVRSALHDFPRRRPRDSPCGVHGAPEHPSDVYQTLQVQEINRESKQYKRNFPETPQGLREHVPKGVALCLQ